MLNVQTYSFYAQTSWNNFKVININVKKISKAIQSTNSYFMYKMQTENIILSIEKMFSVIVRLTSCVSTIEYALLVDQQTYFKLNLSTFSYIMNAQMSGNYYLVFVIS